MPRLYISLTDNDLAKLSEISKAVGMSPAAYAAYLVKLGIAPADAERNSADMLCLRKTMYANLEKVGVGKCFIISALFDSSTWSELPSIQKKQLALELSAYCKNKPDFYSVKKIHGLNQYKKRQGNLVKIVEWNLEGRTHCDFCDDAIIEQKPDIIVLTEVSREGLNSLDKALNETYKLCLCEQDNHQKYLVLVLIRRSLIAPKADPIVQNRSTEDCNLLTVQFTSLDGREYAVVGCRMTTGEKSLKKQYDSERKAFDKVLIPIVKENCEKSEICIVAGDFNNARCLGNLQKKFNPKDYAGKDQINFNLNIIKDSFEEIGFALADNTEKGIPTFQGYYPIDHIFVKGCDVKAAYPIPVGRNISDHDLIIAEISFV